MIEPECHLWGEEFNPSSLIGIEGIVLRNEKEPREIGKRGLHNGKTLTCGACSICVPEHVSIPDRISWMADFIKVHKGKFIDAGATEIVFWIYWYGVQGNMEFAVAELSKIAELGIPLCIDYIFESA